MLVDIDHNIISFSGGKDSTAMLLLAIERETDNLSAVFADTGNEHEQTSGRLDIARARQAGRGVRERRRHDHPSATPKRGADGSVIAESNSVDGGNVQQWLFLLRWLKPDGWAGLLLG